MNLKSDKLMRASLNEFEKEVKQKMEIKEHF